MKPAARGDKSSAQSGSSISAHDANSPLVTWWCSCRQQFWRDIHRHAFRQALSRLANALSRVKDFQNLQSPWSVYIVYNLTIKQHCLKLSWHSCHVRSICRKTTKLTKLRLKLLQPQGEDVTPHPRPQRSRRRGPCTNSPVGLRRTVQVFLSVPICPTLPAEHTRRHRFAKRRKRRATCWSWRSSA